MRVLGIIPGQYFEIDMCRILAIKVEKLIMKTLNLKREYSEHQV